MQIVHYSPLQVTDIQYGHKPEKKSYIIKLKIALHIKL